MTEFIRVPDSNFAAAISVYSMSFFHSFNNITSKNNKFKILSTYKDAGGVLQGHIISKIIPPAFYALEQFLTFFNANCNLTDASTYKYGFGTYGSVSNYGMIQNLADLNKLEYAAPSLIGTAVASAHVYSGFYFIIDTDTTQLLEDLGVVSYDNGGTLFNSKYVQYSYGGVNTVTQVIGFEISNNGATYTAYNPSSTIVCRDAMNLSGPTSLNIGFDGYSMNTRNSYNGFTVSDTLAVVPIVGGSGYKTVYEPLTTCYRAFLSNLCLNTFKLTIRDSSTGEKVDFQGIDWIITLAIEQWEVDNLPQGGQMKANPDQYNSIISPFFNGAPQDHNAPNSNVSVKRNRIT